MASSAAVVAASGVASSSSSVRVVPLPNELPSLPDAYANQYTYSMQQGILLAMKQIQIWPGSSITPLALTLIARLLNRLAHALLLSFDMNGVDTAVFEFPARTGMGGRISEKVNEAIGEAQTKLSHGHSNGGLCFLLSNAKRWLDEFRELHTESTLAELSSEEGQIGLLVWVECIAVGTLELAGGYSGSRGSSVIEAQDVIRSFYNAPNLASMTRYLSASRSYVDIIGERFEHNRSAWVAFDRTYSWYHDVAKVAHYAQQYARGALLPGDKYFFRTHGIRPLQFFGNHRSIDHVLRCAYLIENDTNAIERGAIVFSFEVCDAHGAWMQLVCEVRASLTRARFYMADSGNAVATMKPPSMASSSSASAPHITIELDADQIARFSANEGAVAEPSSASANKKRRLEDQQRGQACAESYSTQCAKSILSEKLLAATQLARLDRFGPSLFTVNHPLKVRVRFTAELIDYASTCYNLPVLPTVLLELIGEYAPISDLPYIQPPATVRQAQEDAGKCFTHKFVKLEQPVTLG
jgi:hypothetical protein